MDSAAAAAEPKDAKERDMGIFPYQEKAMRVITGSARGRRLQTLEGQEVRPTPERIKEAVFSIIQFQIEGRRFLDLFAGSGQMGIEALSRGAREAVFVDSRKDSVQIIRENLEKTGLSRQGRVVNMDSLAFLSQPNGKFDLAFLDPPYRTGLLEKALEMTSAVVKPGGVILCEHPADEELPAQAGDFVKRRDYRHGKILISLYRHKDVVGS